MNDRIRLNSACIKCMINKHLCNFAEDTQEMKKLEYMREMLNLIAGAKPTDSAPVITGNILKLQEKMFGTKMDYTPVKRKFNKMMLDEEEEILSKICSAQDPLKMAVQYAMTGNYIDFGTMSNISGEKLHELLGEADHIIVDEEEFSRLKEDLQQAGKLTYLTDNCGEVVLDKLLIQTIKKLYPKLEITAIVRGKDALNDATMDDAGQVGLTDVVNVIGNGTDITGTELDLITKESRERIDEADVIISKGQGNFETLQGCGKNIYYMFLCKCELYLKRFDANLLQGILVHDRKCCQSNGEVDL